MRFCWTEITILILLAEIIFFFLQTRDTDTDDRKHIITTQMRVNKKLKLKNTFSREKMFECECENHVFTFSLS